MDEDDIVLESTGSYNTLLGSATTFGDTNIQNSSVVGANGVVNVSNRVYLHTNHSDDNVGKVETDGSYHTISDRRFKSFVREDVPGLDFITMLRPVNYKLDYKNFMAHRVQLMPEAEQSRRLADYSNASESSPDNVGFIAQEVHELCSSLNYDFGGLYIPNEDNPADHYTISYSSFVPSLVKAVQEQQEIIEDKQREIDGLRGTVESLSEQMLQVTKRLEALEKE